MGIKAVLPRGTEITLNGLEVVFSENLHFTIKNADTIDQAAEFTHIHGLPCDFSYFDAEKGVDVTYNPLDASRIETTPVDAPVTPNEKPVAVKPRLKAEKEIKAAVKK